MTDLMTERYGGPGRGRRRTTIVVSGVVGVLGLAWVAWAAWFQGTPEVQSSLLTYRVLDQHAVTARISVKASSSDVRASCRVRAYAYDHSVVGERNVRVADVDQTVRLDVPFRTEREATSVELVGCTAPGQSRPR